jgi:hypothetical protein
MRRCAECPVAVAAAIRRMAVPASDPLRPVGSGPARLGDFVQHPVVSDLGQGLARLGQGSEVVASHHLPPQAGHSRRGSMCS